MKGVKEFVTKGADGVGFLGNVGKGIGSLFTGPGADEFGRFGKLGDLVTGPGADKIGSWKAERRDWQLWESRLAEQAFCNLAAVQDPDKCGCNQAEM